MVKKSDRRGNPLWLPQTQNGAGRRAGTGTCPYVPGNIGAGCRRRRIPNGMTLYRLLILPSMNGYPCKKRFFCVLNGGVRRRAVLI